MVRDEYLHDVARILEIPPRAIDFLKEFLLLGEDEIVLDAESKVALCEKMQLFQDYKGSKFPNVNLVNQFIQILSKRGAIVKEKRATYRPSPLFKDLTEPITLTITYSQSGREMKLNTPHNVRPETLQEDLR